VAKRQFKKLKAEIDTTLYSEEQYRQARAIYHATPEGDRDAVLRAWSLFVLSHQTFLHILDNSWAFSRDRNIATTFNNKKQMFDELYVKRLEHTQIFCNDAVKVIGNVDTPDTFHFIDPPYFNADMGHYRGYTEEDFKRLLKRIETLQGRFLLTTYPSPILTEY
jgi:DNA adenine methylase